MSGWLVVAVHNEQVVGLVVVVTGSSSHHPGHPHTSQLVFLFIRELLLAALIQQACVVSPVVHLAACILTHQLSFTSG
jgi:hypothetical protein